jgi:uncharacterized protein (DUF2384 family)
MDSEPFNEVKFECDLCYMQIVSLAARVFGSDAKASRWLSKPKLRFGGLSPLEFMLTE